MYCTASCRHTFWQKANPERCRELNRRHRQKQDVKCRHCGKPVALADRKPGVTICSAGCRRDRERRRNRRLLRVAATAMSAHKKAIGCGVCRYDREPACLEFHHLDASEKEKRIDARTWWGNTAKTKAELSKCVLVCNRCHRELHVLFRRDEAAYWKEAGAIMRHDLTRSGYEDRKAAENGDIPGYGDGGRP